MYITYFWVDSWLKLMNACAEQMQPFAADGDTTVAGGSYANIALALGNDLLKLGESLWQKSQLLQLPGQGNLGIRIFGVLVVCSVLLASLAYGYAFVSVWCFFAAALSFYLVFMLASVQTLATPPAPDRTPGNS